MSKVIQSMFYNANYNLGYPDGQSKFIWGVQQIDFSKEIQKQIIGDQEVFNFNLTSLNPIFDPYHDENKLAEENQRLTAIATKHATRADELYEALEGLLDLVESCNGLEGVAGTRYTFIPKDMVQVTEAREVLDKSRIEAEKGDGICN